MALKQLTEEQIRSWSLEQKDKWWLDNIYKGNMPQLTLRSGLTGAGLGMILCLTNLYVGIRTGWTLGVGITSVILSFALFKALSKFKIGSEMTILENNAMQSIATSAGYMTGPLISSIPAYMMVTGIIIPPMQLWIWLVLLSLLGVLFAFPLKKRFINEEQLPFPEGYAAGVVMDGLHTSEGKDGLFKAKILMAGGGISALIEAFRNEALMTHLKLGFMKLPDTIDGFIYKWFTPSILGTPLKDLTIQAEASILMIGAGGLMGIKTAVSLLLGGIINYFILAPVLIQKGIILGVGFKKITMWALWGGVAMMTTGSLYSFFSKPKLIIQAFRFRKKKNEPEDILKDIELPMMVFVVGIGLLGPLTVWMGHQFFGINWIMGLIAIPLVFIFTLIAVNSTGLTSITPTGALGKLTQLTYSVLSPGNIQTNIMTAGITGEVAANASNLLMDIKPGYMLGAKPRQQAIGHVIGIFAGCIAAIPVFYLIFGNDLSKFGSEKMPMPSALVWKGVAEVLTKGMSALPQYALHAVIVGAILGLVFEILDLKTKGRFPVSGVGMGLAFVLPFSDCFAMSLGGFIFWFFGRLYGKKTAARHAAQTTAARHALQSTESNFKKIFVDNSATLCAGVIAGGSLIGIVLIILETVFFG